MATNTYYSGGRVIPGAGVYLQDQAKAQNAYERALAQLKAQRAQRQIVSGLGHDWQVDPGAQYGTYQAMLGRQGSELDQAREAAQSRGFFGSGLGNQGEGMLRYGQAIEALGFKNQLADWESEYQNRMAEAAFGLANENLGSLQEAYDRAYEQEDYTPYAPPQAPVVPRPPRANVGRPTRPRQFGTRGWVQVPGRGRY